jgi:predicted AAA+ superfamily ATPase
MTLSETHSGPVDLKVIRRYLQQGGMPAVCFLRDPSQIERYWTEWLDTACHRDLIESGGSRLNGDLAYRILEATALLEYPSSAEIATKLKVDARRIRTHLEALESLFLVRPWEPDSTSVGKTLYLPFDCGMAHSFRASLRRLWQTWFAHETLNQARFTGKKEPRLLYNLTARGSFADFVFDDHAVVFNDQAYPSAQMLKSITAIEKRLTGHKIVVASQTDQPVQKVSRRTTSAPWAYKIQKPSGGPAA